MATFPDLTTFNHFVDEARPDGKGTLTLPIRGREYTWHAGRMSVWAMLHLQRLDAEITAAQVKLAAGETVDMGQIVMSTADEQRLDREMAEVPVIVLSALDQARVADVAADAFLKKPLDFDRLLELIRRYCA